ncbi:hypothetical protein [Paraglaciecola aestuariivivens]
MFCILRLAMAFGKGLFILRQIPLNALTEVVYNSPFSRGCWVLLLHGISD